MKVLVIGGTGTVGSQTVAQLLNRGTDVRVMTSKEENLQKLPKGVEGVVGNLHNEESLSKAFDGIDRVFIITPVSQTETEEGLAAVKAARNAGVKRIVYLSVHRLEDIQEAPHFSSKIPIENAIKSSGIEYTILRPNSFFQNDYWFQQPMLEYGIYPNPIGNKGVSRVDVLDIAEAASNALMEDGFTGKTYSLVGPNINTADDTAATFSKYLGKEIKYSGDDLDAWGTSAKQMMPDWMVNDFKIMFKHFQDKGFIATDEDHIQTMEILHRKPHTFDSFAKNLSEQWKKGS
ncbi:MAG: NmrA family NAD(P)-binding protein [Ignavibacterium sp.]|nr:MAG: NmrA family NAD(P)-binding protein [Ignavibacterium sp.]